MYSDLFKSFLIKIFLKDALLGIFGGIMGIPILSNFITFISGKVISKLLDKGIIEFKESMIDLLSEKSKSNYAPMIDLLKEAQYRDSMTPEEEAEYEKRLQDVVKNHPGIVNG